MTLTAADDAFADRLRQVVPEAVLSRPEPRHLQEPRGLFSGRAGVLARPRTVGEVSALVARANAERVAVVPYGGGTGLVGGQVMPDGPAPLLLSLERMQAIRGLWPDENVLVAEAGAILADVQAAARDAGRLFALSLAAEGSARIGGNLATNAGGVNVLRYGSARDLCLGLEAVLPDGTIWNGLSRLRKDNTGYDLKNLLIGSEGTLGVITAAALKLAPVPAGRGVAYMAVTSPEAALSLLTEARAQVGEAVSAFELIHRQGLDFLAEHLPQVRLPFRSLPEWCVLIELGLPRLSDPQMVLATLFEVALERGLAEDGVIAQSEAQMAQFWSVREHMPEANRRVGSVSSHDISVPISSIPDFVRRAGATVAAIGDFRINCFGHLGDGNLHFNVFPRPGHDRSEHVHLRPALQRALHDLVQEFGGSISAEHGIGRLKAGDLQHYGDPAKLAAMRAIKQALDPRGIMNPGAVLSASV